MVRLPRFRRASRVPAITLTARDRDIIRLVHRHRFVRSSDIARFVSGSTQQILRRLQLLYHLGYLERPRAQLEYYAYAHPGSRHIVYGLGNRGAKLLRQKGLSVRLDSGKNNRAIRRMFLEHALFVSEVMIAVELSCRKTRIRLLTEADLAGAHPFRWSVRIANRVRLGVIPDRVFALEYRRPDGNMTRAYFYLEADRGTMPVVRAKLAQTSIYRKLLAYEATWAQDIHRVRFGFHRFRVLCITQSPPRRQALVDACRRLTSGQGLFLFADGSILQKPDSLLSALWHTTRGDKPVSMVE